MSESTNSNPMHSLLNKYSLFLLVAFALILRLWGLGDVTSFTEDESVNIPDSRMYCQTGNWYSTDCYQPPLKQLLFYGSLRTFGDNPLGWRMVNVLCGSLSVLLLVLLAKEFFVDDRIPLIAGLFLSIEPLHILYSRTAFGEIPAQFFFLVCLYATVRYVKGNGYALLFAGISLGCALAVKWYFVLPAVVLISFVLISKGLEQGWRWTTFGYVVSACMALPQAVYALTYYPWFGRGHTIVELLQWQWTSFVEQQSTTLADFPQTLLILKSGSFLKWFVKPILFGTLLSTDPAGSRYLVYMSNFPVWLLTFPALLYATYVIGKEKDRHLVLVVGLFLALYLQFFLVRRPLFFYSSIQLQPFMHLMVAMLVTAFLKLRPAGNRYFPLLFAVVLVWGLYLYPLVIGSSVPNGLYAPLFKLGHIYPAATVTHP